MSADARWLRRGLLALLALGAAGCVVTLAGLLPSLAAAGTERGGGGAGLVRVLPAGNRVLSGPRIPNVNGLASGLDSLWLAGGTPRNSHVLYAVDPANGRIEDRTTLPSRLVMNPGDVAASARAVWVAVGASLYRIVPGQSGSAVTRPFATLPHGGLIGDVVTSPGAVWVDDTTRGTVYRYPSGRGTGRPDSAVTIGRTAGAMASGDGGVWVADPDARTVSRISPARNRVDEVVPTPGPATHLTTARHSLWLTDGTDGVTVVGAGGRTRTIPVGGEPTGLATGAGSVWVASTAAGTLTRVDPGTARVTATVRVGERPYAVAASPQAIWVGVLGQPVRMHPATAVAGRTLGWLLRLCG
jgi:YVTN family beta-propeller protein